MKKYVAFLRAVNVGGHGLVRMKDLAGMFAAVGCEQMQTYIQSGNVIFDVSEKTAAATMRKVQGNLSELLGTEITVVFRSRREIEDVVKRNPFKVLNIDGTEKLYVALLSQKPPHKAKLPLVSSKERLEAFQMRKLDVYIVSRKRRNGMYGFPNNFIEKELGVMATTMNWSTVTKIVELMQANSPLNRTRADNARAG